ncbi:prephenate dehydrogenase [Lacrimispora sp. 210928-DFI.3.58]|uniref:prephenate dehydrogenase n=1 Tax=Lacrimispora sp. 210928-DFI.3.58 TaxID=2883214 RepID=UPI001D078BFD|nr:prephenate dehydrogenase [Lacrimispora sp. 210928-DFI.3.58]MCB7321298.1 prephenate dehydrogenase [Lacrimispora sp. 210928-DFI.3.58]
MKQAAMTDSTIAFIGLGLIGGSIARGLKRVRPDIRIMAYMRTRSRLEQAKKDGIVDVILDGIDEHLRECDLIFLCTPVEYNAQYLSAIRPFLKPGALITDVGSTKTNIHREILAQGLTDCFVGGHPMAGSEKTGYENSTDHLLENAYYIITPPEGVAPKGKEDACTADHSSNIERITAVARTLGAIPLVLDYREHDKVVAAISHVPHLIASSLVNLVKDNDSENGTMKRVAAGGFKDITRIASSSPEMWEQICVANSAPIADMLEKYIASLNDILDAVRSHSSPSIYRLFETSRDYRNSITDRAKGSVEPSYEFTVDIVDEPGSISTLSVILAAKGISIKNIGINNNRERGEGALKIAFYEEAAMEAAWAQLEKYRYDLFRM